MAGDSVDDGSVDDTEQSGGDADAVVASPPPDDPDADFDLRVEPPEFWGTEREKPLCVVALGGNAISPADSDGTYEAQLAAVDVTARRIADLMKAGYKVVLLHGNGPQVGALLSQQEEASPPAQPLSVCGAMSQGQIGYLLAQRMTVQLERRWRHVPVATVLTQTIVDADDPAFDEPTKPVGPYLTADDAERLRERGATVQRLRETGDADYRRVVPSPEPRGVVEETPIKRLIDQRDLVICGGGGGVPVSREEGAIEAHDAVVDKDLLSSVLGHRLNADYLVILTDVDGVYLDYGTADERLVSAATPDELAAHHEDGQFPPGSMGPKVTAACRFVTAPADRQRTAVVTSLTEVETALEGEAGTRVSTRE